MQKGIGLVVAVVIGAIVVFALGLPEWSQRQAMDTLFARDACQGESWLPNIQISADRRIEYCTEAIRSGNWSGKNITWAYNARGISYASIGQYDHAIEDFSYAIKLDPRDAAFHLNLGNAWRQKGDYERAKIGYTEAIQLDPQYAAAYYARGIVKQKMGDSIGGAADIAKARQLQPGIGE